MVGLLIVAVVGTDVDRRLSDVVADGAVFMRIQGSYGISSLVAQDCDCYYKPPLIIVGFSRDIL